MEPFRLQRSIGVANYDAYIYAQSSRVANAANGTHTHAPSHASYIVRHRNLQISKAPRKAKRRVPAYSRALRQVRVAVQRIVRVRLRSGSQRVRGGRIAVKADVV